MIVLGKKLLNDFAQRHAGARGAIAAWVAEVEEATWTSPVDVKSRYPTASIIGGGRIVFNLRGNQYRLDTLVGYTTSIVLAKRIGTHAEYDTWVF